MSHAIPLGKIASGVVRHWKRLLIAVALIALCVSNPTIPATVIESLIVFVQGVEFGGDQ